MQKIFETINDLLKDRIANPFTSAFILSWCILNYKFIVILISNNTITNTFNLIEIHSFRNICDIALKGFIYPAVAALFYVFIYPVPSKFAYAFTLKQKRLLSELRNDIEKTQLLTLEESQRLRNHYVTEIKNLEDLLRQKELENDALIVANKNTQYAIHDDNKIKEPSKDTENFTNNFREKSLGFLEFLIGIADQNNMVRWASIEKYGSFATSGEAKAYLAQLGNEKFIYKDKDLENGKDVYYISDAGHIAAVEFRERVNNQLSQKR